MGHHKHLSNTNVLTALQSTLSDLDCVDCRTVLYNCLKIAMHFKIVILARVVVMLQMSTLLL